MILREHTVHGGLRARASPVIGSEPLCDLVSVYPFGNIAVGA